MTSEEIAKICGVSKTTVSRVINNDPKVKDKTRELVLAAMKKYNYVPKASARRLAGIDSNIIGVFIMDYQTNDSTSRISKSSYFSNLVSLIVDHANNNGFDVLVSVITAEDQLDKAHTLFLGGTISSGIFIGVENEITQLDDLSKVGLPMIIIDKEVSKENLNDRQVVINLDNVEGGYIATKHLIDLGHRRIAHMAGDLKKLSAIDRLIGYKLALEEASVEYDEALIFEADFSEQRAEEMVSEIIDKTNISAIFAANDNMAVGAMKGLKELNLNLPEDVSIIGFDDIEIGQYYTPELSTIHAPFDEIAKRSIEELLYFHENKKMSQQKIELKTSLIHRNSTVSYAK